MDLPAGIPHEAKPVLRQLMATPPGATAELRDRLGAYVARIECAATKNEFLDVTLATRVAAVCEALLSEADRRGTEQAQRWVHAAVGYFLLDDDGDHDLESLCGLDDDALVCNAVAEALGRPDLMIAL